MLHSLCTEVKSSLICSWLSITEYCRHHLYIQICTWIFAEIDPLEWKYLNVFFNIYCNFRFPKYINLFNEIKMFFLLENFEISAGKLFLISCKSAVIDVYKFISPNFLDIFIPFYPSYWWSMTFYQIKKMILNARYTAVRVYGTNVYTYVRVPNLCCAFREFSTQNINRTIDWRDIGQCNLNGHKQKSKINKQALFEFILSLLVHFWSF